MSAFTLSLVHHRIFYEQVVSCLLITETSGFKIEQNHVHAGKFEGHGYKGSYKLDN